MDNRLQEVLSADPFINLIEHSGALNLRDVRNLQRTCLALTNSNKFHGLVRRLRARRLWLQAWTLVQPAFTHRLIMYLNLRLRQHERWSDNKARFSRRYWYLEAKIKDARRQSCQQLANQINNYIGHQPHFSIRWTWSKCIFLPKAYSSIDRWACWEIDIPCPLLLEHSAWWQSVLMKRPEEGVDPDWPWWLLFSIHVSIEALVAYKTICM